MNLMEQNHHTDEEENENRKQKLSSLQEFMQNPYMTPVLLGVIVVLLICIIVLLCFMPDRRESARAGMDTESQQNITEHTDEQNRNDYVVDSSGVTVSAESVEEKQTDDALRDNETASGHEDEESTTVAADTGKTAVTATEEDEDETDVSYSKEFILNEAFPYFEDNRQDAIWDLAHLKRYVKLSSGLKNTNQYYYMGDVNSDGKPNGKGLAIYEDNTYYYGDWVGGVRSGSGTWYRYYINEKSKRNAMGIYTAHIYAGEWADDLPNGSGAEHFDVDTSQIEGYDRIIQNVVGNFTDGLYDGEMFANTVNHIGKIEEWYGVTSKGVFDLWRDMSSIGECSVWRNKDDQDLCLDIDKSENKDQGIQELLKLSDKSNSGVKNKSNGSVKNQQ